MNSRVDQLESQVLALQKQVTTLSSLVQPDDGTAAALVGTWSGSANMVQFRRVVRNGPGGLDTLQFFNLFPAGPNPQPTGPSIGFSVVQPQNLQPMTVQVNPEMWLARGDGSTPVTLTLSRNGMAIEGTGLATPAGEPAVSFNVFGIALSNNFLLLKLRVPVSGNCATSGVMVIQGTASLNPVTRAGMTFTGSAVEGDCSHQVFRLGLTKQ